MGMNIAPLGAHLISKGNYFFFYGHAFVLSS
jgi:hypothetical protein